MAPCLWFSAPAYAADRARLATADLAGLAAKLGASARLAAGSACGGPPGSWHPLALRRLELPDSSHRAWWPLRGGYGCIHLLPELLTRDLPPVIGFSDCSILHAAAWCRGGRPGFYAFMPLTPQGSRAHDSLRRLWQGERLTCDLHSDPTVTPLRRGSAAGPLFAACLRVLAGLVGSPAMPDLNGCLLAIEDIDERPYAIDRCLEQLFHAGRLRGIGGLIGGRFPHQRPSGSAEPTVTQILQRWADRLRVPAIVGLPFGHEADPLSLAQARASRLLVHPPHWCLEQLPGPSA